jgi:hypothetical protein
MNSKIENAIDKNFTVSINSNLELFVVYGVLSLQRCVLSCPNYVYSIYEYFVLNDVSIYFEPNQTIFSILEFLV